MELIRKFKPTDLAYSTEVSKILQNIEEIVKNTETIDQVISNYIVTKYLKESEATNYIKKVNSSLDLIKLNNKIKTNTVEFINKVDKNNLVQIASNINHIGYHKEFLELLVTYGRLQNIDWYVFSELLSINNFYLSMFFSVKDIVKKYDKEISEKVKNVNIEGHNFVKIVINYLTNEVNESNKLFFPNNISNDDFQELVNRYLESDNPNLNILERIKNIRTGSERYKINESIKYKAQKKYTDLFTKIFTSDNTMTFTVDISNEKFDDEIFYRYDTTNVNHITIVFNTRQLESSLTTESILSVIFTQLPIIDEYSKIHALTYNKQKDVFLNLFLNIDKNGYKYNLTDSIQEQQHQLINYYYLSYLEYKEIKIETVIDYYFNYFLKEEYEISDFCIDVNLESNDLKRRIQSLAINMDQIVKQYHLMNSERKVDLDYVNFNSNIPQYDEILSRNVKNNIYPTDSIKRKMYFSIFDNQSMIYYYDILNSTEVTLDEAILLKQANLDKLTDYQKKIVEEMALIGIFIINDTGEITIKKYEEYLLYKDLYYNKSVNYYLVPDEIQNVIDNELEQSNLISSNTLLSKEESDWFNFVLKDKHSNSIGLRNKHMHGYFETRPQKLMEDYVLIVRMVLILLGKIEYDLTIEENEKNNTRLSPSFLKYEIRLLRVE